MKFNQKCVKYFKYIPSFIKRRSRNKSAQCGIRAEEGFAKTYYQNVLPLDLSEDALTFSQNYIKDLCQSYRSGILEIGFGSGEHFWKIYSNDIRNNNYQYKSEKNDHNDCNSNEKVSYRDGLNDAMNDINKDIFERLLYIGCEPYSQGVSNILNHMMNGVGSRDSQFHRASNNEDFNKRVNDYRGHTDQNDFRNLFIWKNDARILLEMLQDDFLSLTYIICPDPWPKKRHHKRRLIQGNLLGLLHQKSKGGAEVIIVTDHKAYAKWIYEILDSEDIQKQWSVEFKTLRSIEECIDMQIDTKYVRKAFLLQGDMDGEYLDLEGCTEISLFRLKKI